MGCGGEEIKSSKKTGSSKDSSADLLEKCEAACPGSWGPLRAPTFLTHTPLHTAQEQAGFVTVPTCHLQKFLCGH